MSNRREELQPTAPCACRQPRHLARALIRLTLASVVAMSILGQFTSRSRSELNWLSLTLCGSNLK